MTLTSRPTHPMSDARLSSESETRPVAPSTGFHVAATVDLQTEVGDHIVAAGRVVQVNVTDALLACTAAEIRSLTDWSLESDNLVRTHVHDVLGHAGPFAVEVVDALDASLRAIGALQPDEPRSALPDAAWAAVQAAAATTTPPMVARAGTGAAGAAQTVDVSPPATTLLLFVISTSDLGSQIVALPLTEVVLKQIRAGVAIDAFTAVTGVDAHTTLPVPANTTPWLLTSPVTAVEELELDDDELLAALPGLTAAALQDLRTFVNEAEDHGTAPAMRLDLAVAADSLDGGGCFGLQRPSDDLDAISLAMRVHATHLELILTTSRGDGTYERDVSQGDFLLSDLPKLHQAPAPVARSGAEPATLPRIIDDTTRR